MTIVSAILCLGALGGIVRLAFDSLGIYGTVLVNLLGTFVLGYLTRVVEGKRIPEWFYIGMSSGFIGAFTTFSSFTTDTLDFLKTNPENALLYVLISVAGGMALCVAGERIATRLMNRTTQDEYSHGHQENPSGKGNILPDTPLSNPPKFLGAGDSTSKRRW